MDKCPEYNFVGTTMSRPSCKKPECPQPGKKRKATVAHTRKENEQEGGSEPPCSPATKVSVSQAEGGRYAKHAHESWPPSMYDATHKVAQNHLLAHFLRWPPSTYIRRHSFAISASWGCPQDQRPALVDNTHSSLYKLLAVPLM